MSLTLTSRGFENEGAIPDMYSKDGGNISPPLAWSGVPEGTKSLALVMDDPDAPAGTFVHWILHRIPPTAGEMAEGRPATPGLPGGIRQGKNGFGEVGYGGPKPPSGTHRYYFHLYALDIEPQLEAGASREELDSAIEGHVLEQTELMGKYQHRETGTKAA